MVHEMPVDPRSYWLWCHLFFPETGEARETNDLKQRFFTILTPTHCAFYPKAWSLSDQESR